MVPLFLSYLNMLLWFQTFEFNYKLEGHELANSDWFSEHIFRLKKALVRWVKLGLWIWVFDLGQKYTNEMK